MYSDLAVDSASVWETVCYYGDEELIRHYAAVYQPESYPSLSRVCLYSGLEIAKVVRSCFRYKLPKYNTPELDLLQLWERGELDAWRWLVELSGQPMRVQYERCPSLAAFELYDEEQDHGCIDPQYSPPDVLREMYEWYIFDHEEYFTYAFLGAAAAGDPSEYLQLCRELQDGLAELQPEQVASCVAALRYTGDLRLYLLLEKREEALDQLQAEYSNLLANACERRMLKVIRHILSRGVVPEETHLHRSIGSRMVLQELYEANPNLDLWCVIKDMEDETSIPSPANRDMILFVLQNAPSRELTWLHLRKIYHHGDLRSLELALSLTGGGAMRHDTKRLYSAISSTNEHNLRHYLSHHRGDLDRCWSSLMPCLTRPMVQLLRRALTSTGDLGVTQPSTPSLAAVGLGAVQPSTPSLAAEAICRLILLAASSGLREEVEELLQVVSLERVIQSKVYADLMDWQREHWMNIPTKMFTARAECFDMDYATSILAKIDHESKVEDQDDEPLPTSQPDGDLLV